MTKTQLFRVFMIANHLVDGLRALATMEIAIERSAHGFEPHRFIQLTRDPLTSAAAECMADAIDTIPMDFNAQLLDDGKSPKAVELKQIDKKQRFIPYSLTTHSPRTPGIACTVHLYLLCPDDLDTIRSEGIESVIPKPDQGVTMDALWIVTGSEIQRSADALADHIGSSRKSSSRKSSSGTPKLGFNPLTFLDNRIAELIRQVTMTTNHHLKRVVVSISGIEWAFVNAVPVKNGPMAHRGPLGQAFDPEKVLQITKALLRGSKTLNKLLSDLDDWASDGQLTEKAGLAVLQVISANGLFSDDGHPNVDRITGRPLQTPHGVIAMRDDTKIETDPFPRGDNLLPRWFPYLSADPLLTLAIGDRGDFGVLVGDLIEDLPRRNYA